MRKAFKIITSLSLMLVSLIALASCGEANSRVSKEINDQEFGPTPTTTEINNN